jgi:hypothetical protein
MTDRAKSAVFLSAYLLGSIVSAGLLIWIIPNHNPSGLDFIVVILLGVLFTFCLSTHRGLEGGIFVFVFCVLLGVVEPYFELSKVTSLSDSLYIAPLVSFIVSRVLYRLNKPSATYEEKRININDQGFDVIGQKTQMKHGTVTWTKVSCINAFKRDLFSLDLICFEFYQDVAERPVEVDEQMEGFKLLSDILPKRFNGFDENWFSKVFQPAFATNLTEIWKKKNETTITDDELTKQN